jgi:hypothetical protein
LSSNDELKTPGLVPNFFLGCTWSDMVLVENTTYENEDSSKI